jgi:uncharacterized protein YgiM (DUF1202 family)
MKIRRLLLTGLALALAAAIPVFAQGDVSPSPTPDPNGNISWPPPVYVLRGEFEIRGTANLPDMVNYFIEFRPLEDPAAPEEPLATEEAVTTEAGAEEEVFFAAILPSSTPVIDDVLGVWDTTVVEDGLYEIRLTINLANGEPVTHTVSPLRVENEPPPFVQVDEPPAEEAEPTQTVPTQPPPPTVPPTEDPTPRVTVSTPNGNVRTGDGTNYQIIASLTQGTTVPIVGISNTGSGWFQVRLENGQIGWMAPSIVTVSGNLNSIPRVQPPPPPATPTFTPIPATATPITQANLVAGIVVLEPATPTCAQTFTVGFDVANLGSQNTAASGIVSLVDTRVADGSVQGTTIGGFPILAPGQTFRVLMPLTIITFYNEGHRITLRIDEANQIPETVEGDNVQAIEYTLQQGSCP